MLILFEKCIGKFKVYDCHILIEATFCMARISFPNLFLVVGSLGLGSVALWNWHSGALSPKPSARSRSQPDVPYTGALDPAPSSSYVTTHRDTAALIAPRATASVRFVVPNKDQVVASSGKVMEEGDASLLQPSVFRTWIAIKDPATGNQGFVRLSDLLTPTQLSLSKKAEENVSAFQRELKEAQSSTGEIPGGLYSIGGLCNTLKESDFGADILLVSMKLIWQDGSKVHFVNVQDPSQPIVYDVDPVGKELSLGDYGQVVMKSAKSSIDATEFGHKERNLFIKDDDGYHVVPECDAGTEDRALKLLREVAARRPPEDTMPSEQPKK